MDRNYNFNPAFGGTSMQGMQPFQPMSNYANTASKNNYNVPEKNKLQIVKIAVGNVHHITNLPEAKSLVVTFGDVTKGWQQSAPYLLFATAEDYHVLKAYPDEELGVLVDEKLNPELHKNLTKGDVCIAVRSTEKKKHRIVVKDGERLNVIATPGHIYAVEFEGDATNELYYILEHGNDLFLLLEKGRRYVVEVPTADPGTPNKPISIAASYIIIKPKQK